MCLCGPSIGDCIATSSCKLAICECTAGIPGHPVEDGQLCNFAWKRYRGDWLWILAAALELLARLLVACLLPLGSCLCLTGALNVL